MRGAAVAQGDELGAQGVGLACTDVSCVHRSCVSPAVLMHHPVLGQSCRLSLEAGGGCCASVEPQNVTLGWNVPYSPPAPSLWWAGCPPDQAAQGPSLAWVTSRDGAPQLSVQQCQGRVAPS